MRPAAGGEHPMGADANRVILTGENPFIRLSEGLDSPATTNASFWRILLCPNSAQLGLTGPDRTAQDDPIANKSKWEK